LALRLQRDRSPRTRSSRTRYIGSGSFTQAPQLRVPMLAAFDHGMRGLGYVEGRNLLVEQRYADDHFERLPALVRELIAWRPDALLVSTTPGNLAAKGMGRPARAIWYDPIHLTSGLNT
jgi:hypothetical protein